MNKMSLRPLPSRTAAANEAASFGQLQSSRQASAENRLPAGAMAQQVCLWFFFKEYHELVTESSCFVSDGFPSSLFLNFFYLCQGIVKQSVAPMAAAAAAGQGGFAAVQKRAVGGAAAVSGQPTQRAALGDISNSMPIAAAAGGLGKPGAMDPVKKVSAFLDCSISFLFF